MTLAFQPPVRRVNRGRGHSYVDANGRKVPGVTTIIGDGIPKPALVNWAAEATAEYAVNQWETLSELPPAARLKELKGARYADRDTAANKGTQVHGLGEKLVQGQRISVPDGLEGYVESYIKFLDDFDVQPVLVERVVLSHKHGYAGTFDLIADLLDPDDPNPDREARRRIRWLLDLKTSRSGIFGETALQLAGYRYADVYMDGDDEQPMLEVERTGAVHVRANGYDLIPVEAGPAQLRSLLYAQQVAAFCADSRALVGASVIAPTTSTYQLSRTEHPA
jgi:hypothetical protein